MLGTRPRLANSLVPMAKPPRLRPVRIRARWRGPTASAGAPGEASGIGETDMGGIMLHRTMRCSRAGDSRITPAGLRSAMPGLRPAGAGAPGLTGINAAPARQAEDRAMAVDHRRHGRDGHGYFADGPGACAAAVRPAGGAGGRGQAGLAGTPRLRARLVRGTVHRPVRGSRGAGGAVAGRALSAATAQAYSRWQRLHQNARRRARPSSLR